MELGCTAFQSRPGRNFSSSLVAPTTSSTVADWTHSPQSARSLFADQRRHAAEDSQEPREYLFFFREKFVWIVLALLCTGCAASLLVLGTTRSPAFYLVLKLESIPIVSAIFTWAHIWLALQMMFYPVKFWGIWNVKSSGYGIGWQGVVPRKAGLMAEKVCDLMIGRLVMIEEIIDRIHLDEFFETLGKVLWDCQANVNERLGPSYFPTIWPKIPQGVKDEILKKVMEIQQDSFKPMKADLRSNIATILNIKDMCVKRYTEEPTLLIAMFQRVGRKEFQFILRSGAQMGLLLGFVQMGLYFTMRDVGWMPWVLLPLSGLVIGNFTNWLAIKMIFRPLHPHWYCRHRVNVQGLFLKRQRQAAPEIAAIITDTCLNARHMINYLVSTPGYEHALEIFNRHTSSACDLVLGTARSVVPLAVGTEQWATMKKALAEGLIEELPKHSSQFLEYIDRALQVEETLAVRLANLPPDQFEGMLHPPFQGDEWMLILLGGVLGVIIGLFQAAVLGD